MTAHCMNESCAWEGTSSQVAAAHGECPKCYSAIRYDFKKLESSEIRKVVEFNRRAHVALTGGICALNGWDEGFLASIKGDVEHYENLSDSMQRNLYRCVMRHERSIADKAVISFAINHAGSDSGMRRDRGRA